MLLGCKMVPGKLPGTGTPATATAQLGPQHPRLSRCFPAPLDQSSRQWPVVSCSPSLAVTSSICQNALPANRNGTVGEAAQSRGTRGHVQQTPAAESD